MFREAHSMHPRQMLLVAGVETLVVVVLVVDEDVVDQDHSAATTPTPTSTPTTRAAARVPTQNLAARSARKLDMKRHHAGTAMMMMMMISNKRLQMQPQQAMVSTQIGTWTVEPRTMSLGNWRR